jgi:hypothetical protein
MQFPVTDPKEDKHQANLLKIEQKVKLIKESLKNPENLFEFIHFFLFSSHRIPGRIESINSEREVYGGKGNWKVNHFLRDFGMIR